MMGKEGKKNKRVDDNIPPNLPCEFKKKKNERVDDSNSPKLPDEFKKVIMGSFKAHGEEIKEVLVIEKRLTASDVDPIQGRFSIPLKSIQNKFLTEAEENLLKSPKENGKELNDIPVAFIEPICQLSLVSLKRQVMMKDKKNEDSPKESVSFMCRKHWNDVVKSSNLKEGQLVQLWAMRVGLEEELWFALVRLPHEGTASDSPKREPIPSDFIKI